MCSSRSVPLSYRSMDGVLALTTIHIFRSRYRLRRGNGPNGNPPACARTRHRRVVCCPKRHHLPKCQGKDLQSGQFVIFKVLGLVTPVVPVCCNYCHYVSKGCRTYYACWLKSAPATDRAFRWRKRSTARLATLPVGSHAPPSWTICVYSMGNPGFIT